MTPMHDAIWLAVLTEEELIRVRVRLKRWPGAPTNAEVVVVVDMINSELTRRELAHQWSSSSSTPSPKEKENKNPS
jgi:hypothetical protein